MKDDKRVVGGDIAKVIEAVLRALDLARLVLALLKTAPLKVAASA